MLSELAGNVDMKALKRWLDDQQTRDALRFALQSAIAVAATYLVLNAMGSQDAFVGLISAVLIVQPSIGGTASKGWDRFIATIVGSGVGLVCSFLVPQGYAVVIALVAAVFVMDLIAGFVPGWRYGAVAAIALTLADSSGGLAAAWDRCLAIGIGVFIGVAASVLVWPDSAQARLRRRLRNALDAAADRFDAALGGDSDGDEARRCFQSEFDEASDAASKMRGNHATEAQTVIANTEALFTAILMIGRSFAEQNSEAFDLEALASGRGCGQEVLRSLITGELESPMDELLSAIEKLHEDVERSDVGRHSDAFAMALEEFVSSLEAFQSSWSQIDTADKASGAIREALPQDVDRQIRSA